MTSKRVERASGAGGFRRDRWSEACSAALESRRLWRARSHRWGDEGGRGLVGFEEGRRRCRDRVVAEASGGCGGRKRVGKVGKSFPSGAEGGGGFLKFFIFLNYEWNFFIGRGFI